jgi:beta-lactamase class A
VIGHPSSEVAPAIAGSSPVRRPPIARRAFLGLLPAAIGWRAFGQRPKDQGEEKPAAGVEALGAEVGALIKSAGAGEVAVAYHDLANGDELLIRADETYHAASTMKVPVLMEVYRQAEEKTLSLDERIALKKEFPSLVDGKPFVLRVEYDSETSLYRRLGERVTIRELARLMITESSNLATNLLVERVTAAKTSELMRELGAGEVRVLRGVEDARAVARGMNSETTARGMATILRRLAERKVVSEKASEEMLAVLRGQKFNEGIPAGLPKGMSVAHKTGSFTGVYHDVAIVEPRDRAPYVLVVLTRGIKETPRASEIVSRVSRIVHEHALGR